MRRISLLVSACMVYAAGCTESESPTAALIHGGALADFHDGTRLVAWVDQFGGPDGDFGFQSAADAFGVYAAGGTSADLDGPNVGGVDAYVRKYDHDGNVLWTDQFGTAHIDRANGIATEGGAIYLAGDTRGNLDDPAAPIRLSDGFVRRYDAAGNLVWSRQFGTDDLDNALAVAAVAGAVYVGGYTNGVLGDPGTPPGGAFVRKYDPDGTVLWTRQFRAQGSDAAALFADASGVYITGRTIASTGPGSLVVDAYARKYGADGTLLWDDQFGDGLFALGLGVAGDAAGAYVVGAAAESFVRRYSSTGILLWSRHFTTPNGAVATSVAADATGAYVGGETSGRLGASHAGGLDVFARKYDPSGAIQWTVQVGTAEVDQANGIAVHGGLPYLVGHTGGDFATHLGSLDAFTARLTPLLPDEQVEHLRSAVDGLAGLGAGQKNSLIAKLDAALARIADGNADDAISSLRAFINEVEAMVRSGRLSAAAGQALIDAASAAITDLGG